MRPWKGRLEAVDHVGIDRGAGGLGVGSLGVVDGTSIGGACATLEWVLVVTWPWCRTTVAVSTAAGVG